jgi:hypothetical protein
MRPSLEQGWRPGQRVEVNKNLHRLDLHRLDWRPLGLTFSLALVKPVSETAQRGVVMADPETLHVFRTAHDPHYCEGDLSRADP